MSAIGTGFGTAAYSLNTAIRNGDVPGIISGVAGLLAAIPGPQSTGFGIAATGLSAMTAGAHAQNGNLSPSDIAGVTSAILGAMSAAMAAGLLTATAPEIAAAAAIAAAYSFLTTDKFDDFVNHLREKLANDDPINWGDLLKQLPDFFKDLNPELNDLWNTARNWFQRRDPLALDLDGDGLETTGITASPTLFDHDGDGIKTGTGWLKGDDAFLALDRNGNGTIDNGSELFGVDTTLANGQKAANGFAALADLDSNHDGQFNNADAQYANVRVWRDLNQNGISEAGELQSLSAAGIASINLTSTASNIALAGGNIQSASGTYTKTNGSTGTVGDFTTGSSGNLDLAQNPFYREFADNIPLTATAQNLPDLHGSGAVRDLREAANDWEWRRVG